jgi:DNA-binding beta-propeller fold protein YncE
MLEAIPPIRCLYVLPPPTTGPVIPTEIGNLFFCTGQTRKDKTMKSPRIRHYGFLAVLFPLSIALSLSLIAPPAVAQSPSPALLVLEKSDNSLAIVDPATFKIIGRVPAGPDPHEIVVSSNGKLAYISNYGGLGSELNTISVVDIAGQKALPPIQLGALHSPHGLCYAGNKLYFTVETNKAIGRYDPAAHSIDWILGIGQDRTHMIVADETQDRIFTSNVNSGTISIIERVLAPAPGPPPRPSSASTTPPPQPQGTPRKESKITSVPSGRGSEGFDVGINGTEVWAANAQDGTVTIIDVATKKPRVTFPISVDRANRLKFTPDGKRVLVSGLGAGSGPSSANLVVIDVATHKEIKQFAFGGGSAGILIVPDGSRAYVAVSAKDKIVAIDLHKLEVIAELSTGKNPDGLALAQAQ